MHRFTNSLLSRISFLAVFTLLVCFGASAHAQPASTSKLSQAAQKAFDDGMALMEAKRFPEACIKLEESQRIEAGLGTQFRLAQCYEKSGRLASAWKNYDAVATAARAARLRAKDPSEQESLQKRETYSQSRADALVTKVGRGALRVPSDVALLPGLAVSIDGTIVPPASWGNLPLDKGTHRIVVQATGKRAYEAELTIAVEGERITVQIPPLQDAPTAAPMPVVDAPVERDEGLHAVSVAGIIVGVVGLAGMGAGIGVGFAAKSKHDDSIGECDASNVCTQAGVDIRDDALSLGTVGTIVFVAGAVLTAGGAGMLIAGFSLGGDDPELNATVSLVPTGAVFRARW